MTDRFKFRAWLKDEHRYSENLNLFNCCEGAAIYDVEEYDDRGSHYTMYKADEVVLEQCTGLKDKNGRLIYDGDYIRAINQDTKDKPDLQFGHIWVDELNCRWVKFDKEELSWNDFCSLIDYDLTLEIEVIGNEHQGLGIKEIVDD